MKKLLIISLSLFLAIALSAQTGKTYYVNSNILNLRNQPGKENNVILELNKYQNVEYIEKSDIEGWAKIKIDDKEGYVAEKYLKKGSAIVSTYEVRIGAMCKDGTTSSATGKGACSHHGGVSYWLTKTEKSIEIIEN